MTAFSTSKTPSDIADVAAPMHVARQCYLVAPNPQNFLGPIIIEILNKKGLKIKKSQTWEAI